MERKHIHHQGKLMMFHMIQILARTVWFQPFW